MFVKQRKRVSCAAVATLTACPGLACICNKLARFLRKAASHHKEDNLQTHAVQTYETNAMSNNFEQCSSSNANTTVQAEGNRPHCLRDSNGQVGAPHALWGKQETYKLEH